LGAPGSRTAAPRAAAFGAAAGRRAAGFLRLFFLVAMSDG
jgi:hypothetical protein